MNLPHFIIFFVCKYLGCNLRLKRIYYQKYLRILMHKFFPLIPKIQLPLQSFPFSSHLFSSLPISFHLLTLIHTPTHLFHPLPLSLLMPLLFLIPAPLPAFPKEKLCNDVTVHYENNRYKYLKNE